MDCAYEKRVLSIVRGREGWDDTYPSVLEFVHHLNEGGLAHERSRVGWVFWRESERQMQHQNQIITLLCHFAPMYWMDYIVQYWGVMEVEEGGQWHYYLSTAHHPFRAGKLGKGICWYRKLCRDHVYVVDMELRGDDQEQLIGGVGRAYRNKRPESTPDLRFYSANQYPMRDEAARCGFRSYVALPLFDVRTNQCYGVLELLFRGLERQSIPAFKLDEALQVAGLRNTHFFVPHLGPRYVPSPRCDITDMLELAVKTVPRLYYAQVWIPCKQCVNMTTNLCCMKRASSHTSQPLSFPCERNTYAYDTACDFHNIQLDLRSFSSSLCDLNIAKNPLAHYAQRFGMYHSFAISLQRLDNPNLLYLLVFFFQSKFREDAYGGDDSLHLLLGMLEMNLMKSFKFEPELLLLKEILVQSRQPNAIECGSIDSLDVIYSFKQFLSESNFMAYLETVDSCCLRPSLENPSEGWVFCWSGGETLSENNVHRNPILVPIDIKERLKTFMKNIALNVCTGYWIIQFWAPTMVGDRCYLQTWNQPYAVGCLAKGIASFRKKCMRHSYYVDDEAKDDELGPPGRVFRNGHIEISPDLSCYTTDEFPVRNYAMHCCSRGGYFALPILDDEHNLKAVGVLDFIGFSYTDLEDFGTKLEAAKLCSTHVGMQPRFLTNEQPDNSIFNLDQILSCKKAAMTELCNALQLINRHNIPQLHVANVWVPNEECAASAAVNMRCMEVVLSTTCYRDFKPAYQVNWIHVQNRKGMVGMVLASENKSCFCQNLSEFGIADQPLSHYQMSDNCDVCFAICLLSSHTGDLLYVLEFLLYQGPPTYEYLLSFLNFLLPIMKHELKSFKMASGRQLGSELVVEVIKFSDANVLDFSGSEEENMFPIQFKSVQYIQKEHQHTREQQTEECSVAASCSKARSKGKRKTGPNLSLEVLKSHFGKKLKDVAEELGIGKSTIKRACRGYGIDRWPCNKKNTSLLTKECAEASQQDMLPSTSNIQPLDASQHLNVPHTITEEKVTVKVRYEEDIIKFELYLSMGLGNLKEAVAKRINLEMGTYKLKYKDEDGDDILLTNDDDLQLCWKSQIKMGRTYIELKVCR